MYSNSTKINQSHPKSGTGLGLLCLSFGVVVYLCLFCLASPVHAAVTATGGVVPTDPTSWTSRTRAYIGYYANSKGVLSITDGDIVKNGRAQIGYHSDSTGEVTVDGLGSIWMSITDSVFVGYGNTSGTLNIINGGLVTVESGEIWVAPHDESLGLLHFDNGTLTTGGFLGAVDDLTGTGTINTHGLVSDVDLVFNATHGLNQTFTINKNTGQNITVNLNVDGSSSMGAGYSKSGTMLITDGRIIESKYGGYIGFKTGSTGEVTVDGVGSKWNIIRNKSDSNGHYFENGDLLIGRWGSGALNIKNNGEVTVEKNTWLARYADSSGMLHFDNGTLTTSSFLGAVDDLTGTGTINTSGLVSDVDLIFDATHGLNQVITINKNADQNITVNLDVDGSGSMGAGYAGVGTMSILDGRVIESQYYHGGFIGYKTGSVGMVTVDGANSAWQCGGTLITGNYGSGTLNITNGGAVNSSTSYIGREAGSSGEITINGMDSTWSVGGYGITVGYSGSGTLNITNGATVHNGSSAYIGRASNSTGVATVDGEGSTWTVEYSMGIGGSGNGTLNITNGGTVSIQQDHNSYIGDSSGSIGTVTVDGTNSMWTSKGDLTIGYTGGNGTLKITNGGMVRNSTGMIGYIFDSIGQVTVDGVGSSWKNSEDLYVGTGSSGGGISHSQLDIINGGLVSNSTGYIGQYSYATGEVTVNGFGSFWRNNEDVYVNHGTLNITNGGAASGMSSYIGYGSKDSEVTVDGAGSTWTIKNLYIGHLGNGILNITNGGSVIVERDTIISRFSGTGTIFLDSGILVTGSLLGAINDLTGTGTIITHGLVSDIDLAFNATHGLHQIIHISQNTGQNIIASLNVDGTGVMGAGYSGDGSMSISDGKIIESTYGYIGYKYDSTGTVTVDGTGSSWTNSGTLTVGRKGRGTLHITGGGKVNNEDGVIGFGSDLTSEVTVDGADSTWANHGNLYMGYYDGYITYGNNGILNITDGGLVSVGKKLVMHGNSFIKIDSDSMFALHGDADDSLAAFLGLIDGPDAIYYLNESVSGWTDITNATFNKDFTLTYLTEGDLIGYTLLTILKHEPDPINFGDVNGDGLVNGFDVDPFIDVLLNGPYNLMADVNQDGVVNGFDVDPFVAVVLGGSSMPQEVEVPEPTTLVLLSLAGLISGRRHY